MVKVRQATLADKEKIGSFLKVAYPDRWQFKANERWEWAYVQNPFRDANSIPVWIAEDEQGNVVGQTCALIEPLWMDGKYYRVGWSVDTFLLPEFRGQGIGFQLQKANDSSHEIFMSLSMSQANRRIKTGLGSEPLESVPVFLKILRHEPDSVLETLLGRLRNKGVFVRKFVHNLQLHKVVAWGLTLREKIRNRQWSAFSLPKIIRKEHSVELVPIDRFDDSITELCEQIAPKFHVMVYRSAEYLNWKFVQQPHMNHVRWLACRNGNLCGYLILRRSRPPERNTGILVDMFASPEDGQTIDAMLDHTISYFYRHKVNNITAASNVIAYQKAMIARGFKNFKTAVPVIRSVIPYRKDGWLLSKGDQDWDQYPVA